MVTAGILLIVVLWLAWSNGGNDNFMGVATLYGSGTMTYRTALAWATVLTAAGSLVSIMLAGALVATFSGRGVVPQSIEGSAALLIAVAAAAGTKFLATMLGMPTSTTHALTGGLIGIGLVAGGAAGSLSTLGAAFILPLALSPLLAIGIISVVYPMLHHGRRALGITSESCLCISESHQSFGSVRRMRDGSAVLSAHAGPPRITAGTDSTCVDQYGGALLGVRSQTLVNAVHIVSGGAVCFARAVNDTPKIAALLLVAGSSVMNWQLGLIAAAMTIGGLVHSRRIARTMSERITEMNTGQGTAANLVTSSLVMVASLFGLPVSATHVSCSSIFGIGVMRGRPRWGTISSIVLTWIVTLPLAAVLGAICYSILSSTGGLSA